MHERIGCFTKYKSGVKSLKCHALTNFSIEVGSTEYESGQKSSRLGVAQRAFSFSCKTLEKNDGQVNFSKFDYQKFSNGSQSLRTTY